MTVLTLIIPVPRPLERDGHGKKRDPGDEVDDHLC